MYTLNTWQQEWYTGAADSHEAFLALLSTPYVPNRAQGNWCMYNPCGSLPASLCTLLAVLCRPVSEAVTSLPVCQESLAALHAYEASFSLAMRSLRLRRGAPGAAAAPEAAAPLCDKARCCASPSMAAPSVSCCTDLEPCHVSSPSVCWRGGAALLVALPADTPLKITDSEALRCHERQYSTAIVSALIACRSRMAHAQIYKP